MYQTKRGREFVEFIDCVVGESIWPADIGGEALKHFLSLNNHFGQVFICIHLWYIELLLKGINDDILVIFCIYQYLFVDEFLNFMTKICWWWWFFVFYWKILMNNMRVWRQSSIALMKLILNTRTIKEQLFYLPTYDVW